MLGRLARWLRLIGYDTLYFPHIEDSLILKISREENRTLLTRDTRLVKVRGLKDFLLLNENDTFKQLKSVIVTFRLKTGYEQKNSEGAVHLSRCPVCNSLLDSIQKGKVKKSVPEYVYNTSDVFLQCSGCKKLYWEGTHPGRFKKKLSEILS